MRVSRWEVPGNPVRERRGGNELRTDFSLDQGAGVVKLLELVGDVSDLRKSDRHRR